MIHPKFRERTYRGKTIRRCAYWWERRAKGMRYVFARGQCTRMTGHASGYCSEHRPRGSC